MSREMLKTVLTRMESDRLPMGHCPTLCRPAAFSRAMGNREVLLSVIQ